MNESMLMLCIQPLNEAALDCYANAQVHYEGDLGVDLCFPEDVEITQPTTLVPLRVKTAVLEIPADSECRCNWGRIPYALVPRSSIYKTPFRQSNSIGIIDAYYTGELHVPIDTLTIINGVSAGRTIEAGTRLFQLITFTNRTIDLIALVKDIENIEFDQCPRCEAEKKIKLTIGSNDRGEAGFGSTGI